MVKCQNNRVAFSTVKIWMHCEMFSDVFSSSLSSVFFVDSLPFSSLLYIHVFSLPFNACNMSIMIVTFSQHLLKYTPQSGGCLRFVGYFAYILCGRREPRTPDLYRATIASFVHRIRNTLATPIRFRQKKHLPDFEGGSLGFGQH